MYLGNIQRDLKLNFEKGTEVLRSCGATLNGQHWIIGGNNEKRQVSLTYFINKMELNEIQTKISEMTDI